jgi:chitinase
LLLSNQLKKRRLNNSPVVESLESRRLMTAFAGQVVGYLPDYEFSHFTQIDLTALTHINYFSVTASSIGALGTTSSSGFSFSQLQTLVTAAHADGVTVSITVDPGSAFQTIAASSSATTTFVNNLIAFCSTYHLDGVDLDYEPGTLTTAQKNQWGSLLAALHAQTAAHGLTLSEAMQVSQDIVPAADAADLDWDYLMDYALDFNNPAPYNDSITYLTNWTNTYGVPKSKIVVGVPFYAASGTSWSNSVDETDAQIFTSYAAANGGAYPAVNVDSITINGVTWGFNNITTLQQKAQYIIQNGYAGMMIWELGQDHFNSQGKYDASSLLPAIKSAMTIPWMTASAGAAFSYTGTSLTVTSGTVTFNANASVTNPGLALTVNSGANVIFDATQNLGALNIAGGTVTFADPGAAATVLTSLSITNGGKLNLQGGQFTIPDKLITQITGYITQGYNLGHWNGTGIISSTAASGAYNAIGYFDNGTSLTVGFTAYGDANLDGLINADDISLMLTGQSTGKTRWQDGNFNYDNQINADDWMLLFYASAATQAASQHTNFSTAAVVLATETVVMANPSMPIYVAPVFAPIQADTNSDLLG